MSFSMPPRSEPEPYTLRKNISISTQFIESYIFDRQRGTEPTLITGYIHGSIDSGKTTQTKALFNKQLQKPEYSLENTNRIYTNNINVVFDKLDSKPNQFIIIDDAYRHQSGRGSMSAGRLTSMSDYLEIRHIYEDKFPDVPAKIIMFLNAQVADTGLDKIIRSNLDVVFLKSTGIGLPARKIISEYLHKNKWLINELTKINKGISGGNIALKSACVYVTRAQDMGVYDGRAYFPFKNKPAWKFSENPGTTFAQTVNEYTKLLIEQMGVIDKPDNSLIDFYLWEVDPDLSIKLISKIKTIYKGTCIRRLQEEPEEETKAIIIKDPIIINSSFSSLETAVIDEIQGKFVPFNYFRRNFNWHSIGKVISELLKVKRYSSDGKKWIELNKYSDKTFRTKKINIGTAIFIPNPLVKYILLRERRQ